MIKKIILFLVLINISVFADQPNWSKDSFYQTIIKAKKQNKLVIVYFSQDNCPSCEYMKDITFDDNRVSIYLDKYFIPIEINISNESIPSGFKVFGTPTVYFLNSHGQKIGRQTVGGMTISKFKEKMEEIRKLAN